MWHLIQGSSGNEKIYNFSGRRKGRMMAIEAIYRFRLMKDDPEMVLLDIKEREDPNENEFKLAKEIVKSFKDHSEMIERVLNEVLENWEPRRVLLLDRAIIETSLAEIIGVPDIPVPVSIDEAINIARIYSTEKSPQFVNGILDSAWRRLRDSK